MISPKNAHLIRHPEPILRPLVSLNPLISPKRLAPSKFANSKHFISRYEPPDFINPHSIPQSRIKIKGIDTSGYMHLRSKTMGPLPIVAKNRFLSVKFFPDCHFISKLRKSNIALVCFNNPIPMLNDPVLEKGLKSYNGNHRNLAYFTEKSHPLTTAVGRARYRKLLRDCLCCSVQNKPVEKTRGVYYVNYNRVPVTDADRREVQKTFDEAVARVVQDFKSLSNKSKNLRPPKGYLSRVKMYNTFEEDRLDLSYPKLPFI